MWTARLVLASSSPRRRELLARLGRPFEVIPAHVDECLRDDETPHEHARRLAVDKARSVCEKMPPGTLVLGADTIVIHGGAVLGKPRDRAEARQFLLRLRGRAHEVATAVALADSSTGAESTGLERTVVWMRDYSDSEINAYIASGDPMDKAGAYAIQSETFKPVAKIRGSRSNVVGLPVGLVARLLAASEQGKKATPDAS